MQQVRQLNLDASLWVPPPKEGQQWVKSHWPAPVEGLFPPVLTEPEAMTQQLLQAPLEVVNAALLDNAVWKNVIDTHCAECGTDQVVWSTNVAGVNQMIAVAT